MMKKIIDHYVKRDTNFIDKLVEEYGIEEVKKYIPEQYIPDPQTPPKKDVFQELSYATWPCTRNVERKLFDTSETVAEFLDLVGVSGGVVVVDGQKIAPNKRLCTIDPSDTIYATRCDTSSEFDPSSDDDDELL